MLARLRVFLNISYATCLFQGGIKRFLLLNHLDLFALNFLNLELVSPVNVMPTLQFHLYHFEFSSGMGVIEKCNCNVLQCITFFKV